jgi:hypothetical protein
MPSDRNCKACTQGNRWCGFTLVVFKQDLLLVKTWGQDLKKRLAGLSHGQFQSGGSALALHPDAQNVVVKFQSDPDFYIKGVILILMPFWSDSFS